MWIRGRTELKKKEGGKRLGGPIFIGARNDAKSLEGAKHDPIAGCM